MCRSYFLYLSKPTDRISSVTRSIEQQENKSSHVAPFFVVLRRPIRRSFCYRVGCSTSIRGKEMVAPAFILHNHKAGRCYGVNLLLLRFYEEVKALGFLRGNFLPVLHDKSTEYLDRLRRRAIALFHGLTSFLLTRPVVLQVMTQIRHHREEPAEQHREVSKRAPAFLHLPAVVKLSKNYAQSSSQVQMWLVIPASIAGVTLKAW